MVVPRRKRQFNIEYFSNLVRRKRFVILVPIVLSLSFGIFLSLHSPRIYEARTLILVEPKSVPDQYIRAIVPQDVRSRIGTLTQQIMSRSNLEKVIETLQLFNDSKHQHMFMEDKLEALRDKISVKVMRAHGGADAFAISYSGSLPETVMQVTNTLATLFIESNLQVREEQAQGTSSFLDDELENMRSMLGRIESELQGYRRIHMGELPEQLDSNLKMLETFRIQMEERKERLRNERNRLASAENEIEQLKASIDRGRKEIPSLGTREGETSSVSKLEQLRDELKGLQSIYTPQHPNVIRLKSRIEALEKEEVAAPSSGADKPESAVNENPTARLLPERQRQRNVILSTIHSLQEDIQKIDRQIIDYQRRIERTPKREEEMFALKRDHQNIQESYKSLLARKLEADMAVNLERKKKGEQFQVLDYAKLPEKPVSPNLKKIFFLAVATGIFLGLGLAIGSDALDETVRQANDVAGLGIANLCTIPVCLTPQIARRGVLRTIATVCSISTVCILTMVFAYIVMRA